MFNRKKLASEGGSKASAPPTKPASIRHNDVSCFHCGRKGHSVHKCPFKDSKCHKCGKIGHLRVVCRSKTSKSGRDSTGQIAKTQWMCAPEETVTEDMALFSIGDANWKIPMQVEVLANGQSLRMEVDLQSVGTPVFLGFHSAPAQTFLPTLSFADQCMFAIQTGLG